MTMYFVHKTEATAAAAAVALADRNLNRKQPSTPVIKSQTVAVITQPKQSQASLRPQSRRRRRRRPQCQLVPKSLSSHQQRHLFWRPCHWLGSSALLVWLALLGLLVASQLATAAFSDPLDQMNPTQKLALDATLEASSSGSKEDTQHQLQQAAEAHNAGLGGRGGDQSLRSKTEPQWLEDSSKADSKSSVDIGVTRNTTTNMASNDGLPATMNETADDDDDDELSHNQIHKLMSEQDLRRTFQVESHDQVPEYQILKLTVQSDGSHLISPISDLGEFKARRQQQQQQRQTIAVGSRNSDDDQLVLQSNNYQQKQQQQHKETSETSALATVTGSNLSSISGDKINDDKDKVRVKVKVKVKDEDHHLSEEEEEAGLDTSKRYKRDIGALTKSDTGKLGGLEATKVPDQSRQQLAGQQVDADKLIVMNLSTFGRDFKLRLKRNADFQQRIKDMKMFLAESTSDGQLRYTEIKAPAGAHQQHHQQQQQQHKQEPHKRAATVEAGEDSQLELQLQEQQQQQQQQSSTSDQQLKQQQQQQQHRSESSAKADDNEAGKRNQQLKEAAEEKEKEKERAKKKAQQQRQQDHLDIGATYHDEQNLAALLIEHDKLTGRIQVDGTIGNDFVIKPMPRATIDALAARNDKRNQQQVSADLERSPSSPSSSAQASSAAPSSPPTSRRPPSGELQRPDDQTNQVNSSASSAHLAGHLHDDDPHDDDEMFLDEDEALELAHLHGSSNQASHLGANNLTQAQQAHSKQAAALKTLSKAASERKWRKYRKLLAQTQVPKLVQGDDDTPKSSANERDRDRDTRRARRNTTPKVSGGGDNSEELNGRLLISSHHIVYKLKPSSEASSSEHKHSFMLAPGQQTMEEMVRRFPQKRSIDDSTNSFNVENRLTAPQNSRLTGDHFEAAGAAAGSLDESSLTDMASDPMGGQFYLEPGLISGFERAGHSDWMLFGSRSQAGRAPPPYAFNGTEQQADPNQEDTLMEFGGNATTRLAGAHRRHKRSVGPNQRAGGMRMAAGAPIPRQQSVPNRRHKRQAPDVVWPEVLLVVDYDSFLLHGGDSREVKRYFVSFWNGVDLRYKLLVNPHIRISLAGMIVAKDRDATPYLERNRLRAPNADAVDAAGALTDMGKYLYREDRLPTYDLAVVITKLDMCRRRYEGGRCNRGTAGFAYVGGACVVNKRLEKVNSVAIIEDSGGFSGIIVAAHEVGHLLGCVHDGSPPPSYLGGPGATHCPWEDGFIMSDLRHTERGFRWSQCSVEQFKHFLNGETATCLYNYPHESQMLHRLLPGSMLSLDDQCKRDRGTNACFKDARVCAQLFCFDSASGYCVSYRPAAEGSPCGDGHVCRNGKCVGEIENIIPDYTHQTQTVVAAGRGARPPLGGVPVAHQSARLADNGLSASSTSTATSSLDQNTPLASKSVAGTGAVAQISSRMDSFPGPDSTMGANYNQQQQQQQQLYSIEPHFISNPGSTTSALVPSTSWRQAAPKSAKLISSGQFGGRYPTTAANFATDLGHSATTQIVSSSHAAHSMSTVAVPSTQTTNQNLNTPRVQQQQHRNINKRAQSRNSNNNSNLNKLSTNISQQTSSNLFPSTQAPVNQTPINQSTRQRHSANTSSRQQHHQQQLMMFQPQQHLHQQQQKHQQQPQQQQQQSSEQQHNSNYDLYRHQAAIANYAMASNNQQAAYPSNMMIVS